MGLDSLKNFLSKYGLLIIVTLIFACFFLPIQIRINLGVETIQYVRWYAPVIGYHWDFFVTHTFEFESPYDLLPSHLKQFYNIGLAITIIALIIAVILILLSIFMNKVKNTNIKYLKVLRTISFGLLVFVFISLI